LSPVCAFRRAAAHRQRNDVISTGIGGHGPRKVVWRSSCWDSL